MSSNPNTSYGNKPFNEAVESLNAQQLERETDAVAPFANVHVELTRAVRQANLQVNNGNKQMGGDDSFNGIDGAYDLMRLAENAMHEARHEPRRLKPHEALFIDHMQAISDMYTSYAQLTPGLKEVVGVSNPPNIIYPHSENLQGNEAHDYIIQAEYAAAHPYDIEAALAAEEAEQALNYATGYYRGIDRFTREMLDDSAGVNSSSTLGLDVDKDTKEAISSDVNDNAQEKNSDKIAKSDTVDRIEQPKPEQESVTPRTKKHIAKEVIKAIANDAEQAQATNIDWDEDDLFAAMQHDFKDFTPSPEMQANEDFGGVLTERGQELLAKDRQSGSTHEENSVNSEAASEGQEWFDAMNESFNSVHQDKSVEVSGEMIEVPRKMDQLDDDDSYDDISEVKNVEQTESPRQNLNREVVDAAIDSSPELSKESRLSMRVTMGTIAGHLMESARLSRDEKEISEIIKAMERLSEINRAIDA